MARQRTDYDAVFRYTAPMASPRKPVGAPETIEAILDKLDLLSEDLKIIQRSLERLVENKNGPSRRSRPVN